MRSVARLLVLLIAPVMALAGGDIILSVQGISLAEGDGYQNMRGALARLQAGDRLRVRGLRGGRQIELSAPVIRGH